jgi:hypothetical protein
MHLCHSYLAKIRPVVEPKPLCVVLYLMQKNLVSAGSIIYLDGTDTSWQRTYACQPLTKEHEGIYVDKNISFISTGSRAHIACSYGNFWIVDGSGSKGGIQVNFKGLAFRNSSFDFVDASVNFKNCTFRFPRDKTTSVEFLNS